MAEIVYAEILIFQEGQFKWIELPSLMTREMATLWAKEVLSLEPESFKQPMPPVS